MFSIKKQILICFILFFISSCSSKNYNNIEKIDQYENISKYYKVEYKITENYFVKNDAKIVDFIRIESMEEFDTLFGFAKTMENSYEKIDFSNNYVLVMMLPETFYNTEISPLNLVKNKAGQLILVYDYKIKEKRQFSVIPFFAVIVHKKNKGDLILIKKN